MMGLLQDILDACAWARETLPRLIPEVKMDPTKLVVAGGAPLCPTQSVSHTAHWG